MKAGAAVLLFGVALAGICIPLSRVPDLLALAAPSAQPPLPATLSAPTPTVVIAPGRIEPDGGVIRIGAPIDLGASVVARLLVAEGDRVAPGQVLAILENHQAAEAALAVAERHRDLMRARLADARGGTAAALIRIREAALAAARFKLEYARRQLARTKPLLASGDVAAEKNDQAELEVASDATLVAEADSERAEAQAAYTSGIAIAIAELAEAEAAVEQARANVERTVLRAPRAARVLRIIARPGEQLGIDGFAEIGDTEHLLAVADIYEADAGLVRVGQRATISGRALSPPRYGTVASVGLITSPRRMEGVDPVNARGGRVVQVRIRLDTTAPAIIGGEVRVAIGVAPMPALASRRCRDCAPANIALER